jgi:hypothetical protein
MGPSSLVDESFALQWLVADLECQPNVLAVPQAGGYRMHKLFLQVNIKQKWGGGIS